jgi:hypothetical protein
MASGLPVAARIPLARRRSWSSDVLDESMHTRSGASAATATWLCSTPASSASASKIATSWPSAISTEATCASSIGG